MCIHRNYGINLMTLFIFMIASFMIIDVRIAAAENQSKVIYAFWPYWTDPSSYQPDWDMLTHIAYHAWEVNKDGTLKAPRDINRFNVVKNLSRQNGIKIIISIKGFDKDTLDDIFAYHKGDLANNISIALQEYGADGVNLDFEYPRIINIYTNTQNSDLFEEFMKILYTKLNTNNKYYISLNTAGNIEEVYLNTNLSQYIDVIFLRGYNYHSSNSSVTGAPSPYGDIINSVNIIKKYYPSDQIVLGLYFSGYDWPSSSGEPESNTVRKGVAITMKNATTNANIYGRLWNSKSQTPWYKYQIGGVWHQVWYDDDESLGLKLDYVSSENIRGVGFWALGYDGNNANIWNIVRYKLTIRTIGTVISTDIAKPIVTTQKTPGFELIASLFILILLAKSGNKKK